MPDEKIDAVLRELQAGRERDADAERRNDAASSALLSAINKLESAIKSSIYSKNEPVTERASMGTLFTVVGAISAIGAFAKRGNSRGCFGAMGITINSIVIIVV